jgi:anti-anti-sigma factor
MEISVRKEKNVSVVSVTGRMDAVTAPEFEKNLSELMSKGEKKFLVNLAGLEYISSAGLRSILVIAKQSKAGQGEVIFFGLRGPVEEVFKISGFHSIFKIFDSEEAALNQI